MNMHEFILQFFTNFCDKYRCTLCGKVFRFSGDHRYLDTHLRSGHKLTERQIIEGPKSGDVMTTFNTVTPDELQHRRRCQNGKGNASLPSVVSTPQPVQNLHENTEDNQQIIHRFYRKIPNGYLCTLCNRQFIKKSDHILVCHISMAHPSLRADEPVTKPKVSMPVAVNLPHDDNEPDISEYFHRFNSRLQCILCKLLFGNSKHCLSHMKLKHYDTYRTLPLVVKKIRKKDALTEKEKNEKLKSLNYNPMLPNMMVSVNYDDSDEDNIVCDFFEPVDDKMQCLICDFMIKTKSASFLLKHLRTNHSIFNIDRKTKKMVFDGPPVKKAKMAEPEKKPYDLFDNYNTPSLSENDSDFVWNFFTLTMNGEKITCMCCGLEFVRKTYSSLVKHLQLMHPSVYSPSMDRDKSPDLPEPLSITMRRKTADPLRKPRSFKSERMLTKFLISHGVSYEVTEDPNLHLIQRSLNKVTSLDNGLIMDGIIEDCVQDSTLYMKISNDTPITITTSFYTDDKEVFIAFALHHFDENLERSNNVVLRKLKGSKLSPNAISKLIDQLASEQHFSTSRIRSIVVDDKYLPLFANFTNCRTFTSFHKSIDDFARFVIKIAQFDKALNSLNKIMEAIMNDDDLVSKLELLIKAKENKIDLTLTKTVTWYHCLEMLSMIFEDESNFQLISTFTNRWIPGLWLEEEHISNLAILVNILREINTFAKIASYEDGTISSVVPLIKEIITNLTSKPLPIPIAAALNTLIDCHLRPFLDSTRNNVYTIAMYLDPRYTNSDQIYTSHEWAMIEQKVKKMIMDEDQDAAKAKHPTVPDAIGVYSREVSRELVVYTNLVNSYRPGLQASDCSLWWMRQRNKIPLIASKASHFFCTPTCTLDAEYFFGKGGKFAFLNSTMGYRQFSNAMIVASEQEPFKGRGYFANCTPNEEQSVSPVGNEKDYLPTTSEKAPPLPAKIAGFASIRNSLISDEDKCSRIRKQHMVLMQPPLNTSRFIRRNSADMDDLDEFLMIPPPPVLESMVDLPTASTSLRSDPEGVMKIEPNEIKKEVEDVEEDVKPNVSEIPIVVMAQPTEKKKVEKTKPAPPEQLIKTEVKIEEPDY